MYPPEEQAVFEAAWRVLDNAMLISECQDFIGVLKEHRFELVSSHKSDDMKEVREFLESIKKIGKKKLPEITDNEGKLWGSIISEMLGNKKYSDECYIFPEKIIDLYKRVRSDEKTN